MKVKTYRIGGHRATVTTKHQGGMIKLKISDGHSDVEITLTPAQAGEVIENIASEQRIAAQLQRAATKRDGFTVAAV